MKFIDEYRDPGAVRRVMDAIAARVTREWTIMEVCGGQTHAIVRSGLDALLPEGVKLAHGPGCPVCVTPLALIDRALAIAARPGVIFCSFGDMLRVPGGGGDLFAARADGADVRVVYSPLDALTVARENSAREVVFFGVGFETTAPATALAVRQAMREGMENFSILPAHVLVVPAMEAILASPRCRVQAFLAAGHVCSVTGVEAYRPLSKKFKVPVVATGFEPLDLAHGVAMCIEQLEAGRAEVEIQYRRGVKPEGNRRAWKTVEAVYGVTDRDWRGIGTIPQSGLKLRPEFEKFDAALRFDVESIAASESPGCIAGEVLQGFKKPSDCPAFGQQCTPDSPLGAPMVSGEGACAAYYRFRR